MFSPVYYQNIMTSKFTMKQKRNLWTKFLVLLLAALGMAWGDDGDETVEPDYGPILYGSPSASYKVIGTITDENGEAISDAQIIFGTESFYYNDTIMVDKVGNFSGILSHIPDFYDKFYLKTEAKGYQTDSIAFNFDGPFDGGDGEWYAGVTTKEFEIKLKKDDGEQAGPELTGPTSSE